jgi:hypothetical protein
MRSLDISIRPGTAEKKNETIDSDTCGSGMSEINAGRCSANQFRHNNKLPDVTEPEQTGAPAVAITLPFLTDKRAFATELSSWCADAKRDLASEIRN